jgi:hypothetical protein
MRLGSSVRVEGGPVPAAMPMPEARWQQVWFAARRQPWSSLAVVPSHPGTSARVVAEALAAVGRLHGQRPTRFVDAEGTALPGVDEVLASLGAITGRDELAVAAVGCPLAQATSIPIARACDVALLVVPLGESRFAEAHRVIDLVGTDRFVGAVTFALREER